VSYTHFPATLDPSIHKYPLTLSCTMILRDTQLTYMVLFQVFTSSNLQSGTSWVTFPLSGTFTNAPGNTLPNVKVMSINTRHY